MSDDRETVKQLADHEARINVLERNNTALWDKYNNLGNKAIAAITLAVTLGGVVVWIVQN